MSEPRKQKLTLSVDKEVVDRAKELGLNLSEITEKVLRGFAFSPKEGNKAEVYAKYKELFATMQPILGEHEASVEIAHYWDEVDKIGPVEETIFLNPTGDFWSDTYEASFSDIEKIPHYALHEPRQILANFIKSLSEQKQRRRERLGELEMAKRIVLAISESLRQKPETSAKDKPERNSSKK